MSNSTLPRAAGIVLRLLVTLVGSYALVGLATRLADPLIVAALWSLLLASVLVIGPARRRTYRWIAGRGNGADAGKAVADH